ncbi:MAG: DUF1028 domain-containing protein [Planctomycetes bacterium]|nr:DUF1028 domain-containing protein [Planctomycetota bacterium]
MPFLRPLVAFLFALCALASPALATWSIVIVDLATGEVALGIATCLTGFDLRPNTVVVVPGLGVACAQSFVGPLTLRELIRTGLLNGTPASQILAQLAAADGAAHQTRQYGIASLVGGTVTFTGNQAGPWAGGVTGQVGSLVYAIQGNVLTGQPVVTAAEQALQTTVGSLGDKLMAAMQAARQFGGDGRCSCNPGAPTSCGSPPPSFAKSSHIGLMILSRPSDVDAACNGTLGCGAGQYWMDLNVANQPASAPDAVVQLQALYNTWKANQVGRPDHFQSTVTMSSSSLRANGLDTLTGTVWLRDAAGNSLGNSLPVTVGLRPGSTANAITFSSVTPQANGSYTFTMRGEFDAGTAILDVATTDAFGRVGIWPQPAITVTDVFGACGSGALPNGGGNPLDVLRIGGSSGTDRVVPVGFGQPFTLSVDPPAGGTPVPPVGLFALWAHLGVPAPGTEVPLGPGLGSLCFTPFPFGPSPSLLLADSFGLGGTFYAPGAPWSVVIPGVPALLDFALQGVMAVDPAASFAATNAVMLRLRPLPAPTLVSVTPTSPTPGQTVTIVGTGFLAGLSGAVSGTAVAMNVVSATQATFTMPNGAPCDAVLTVQNLGSTSAQRPINPTPVVVNSTPSGLSAGGTQLLFTGNNLLGTTVTLNGVPVTITSQFNAAIFAVLPPGSPGPATFVIRNPNGCQTMRPFTYL